MAPRINWGPIRELLWKRCGGLCEASGVPLDPDTFDVHHRRNKGMGGTSRPDRDAVWNLLALDPLVHNGGPQSVHGRRKWAEDRGFLVPKNMNRVQLWPVKLHDRTWVLLRPDGEYHSFRISVASAAQRLL
jgi:hypothetical protein